MVASIFTQVVLRYGFSVGLAWTEELARMMMILFAFMSAPIIYRRGETIAVNALIDYLQPNMRAIVGLLIHALVLLLAVWFVVLSWEFTVAGAKIRALSLPITMNYIYIVMPISFFAFVLVVLQMAGESLCHLLSGGGEAKSE